MNLTEADVAAMAAKDARVFEYSKHFDALWSQITSGTTAPALPRNVFLIWDGMPDEETGDDINLRNHLTAYDWAIAMLFAAQRAFANRESIERFNFSLRILPVVTLEEYPGAFALRIIPLFQSRAFPWLTQFPLHADYEFAKACRDPDVAKDGTTLFETFVSEPRSTEAIAILLKDMWRNDFTKAGKRHSVSNTIGPMALARCLSAEGFSAANSVLRTWFQGSDHLKPNFWRLMETLGLLPPLMAARDVEVTQSPLGGQANEPFVKEDLFGQFRKVRFALVDDQAAGGFHQTLSAFLLGHDLLPSQELDDMPAGERAPAPVASSRSNDHRYTLSSFSNADVLVSWLRNSRPPADAFANHRPVFGRMNRVSKGKRDAAALYQFDILFLDLRLFGLSGGEKQADAEKSLMLELLEIAVEAREVLLRQHNGVSKKETSLNSAMAAARKRLDGDCAEEIIGHLALLPILISIFDPTTPIILFSSTRQKSVMDLLHPFKNIIKSFAKISITGYLQEDSTNFHTAIPSLVEALREALVLHEKRCLWDLTSEFKLEHAVSPPCIIDVPVSSNMPQLEKRFLANIYNRDLPIHINDWYAFRLRTMLLEYIIGEVSLEYIYKAYEWLESNLSIDQRGNGNKPFAIYFDYRDFDKFKKAGIIKRIPPQTRALDWVKKARNKVVHGVAGSKQKNADAIKYAGLIAMWKLLFGIHDQRLREKLNLLLDVSNPLIQAVVTGQPQDRRRPCSGPLALSVATLANELGA